MASWGWVLQTWWRWFRYWVKGTKLLRHFPGIWVFRHNGMWVSIWLCDMDSSKINIKHLRCARHNIKKIKLNRRDMVSCLLKFHSNKDIKGPIMVLSSSLLWRISGLTGAQRRNYVKEYSELSQGRRIEAKARRKNGSWLSEVVRVGNCNVLRSLMGIYSVCSPTQDIYSLSLASACLIALRPHPSRQTPCHWALLPCARPEAHTGELWALMTYFLLSMKGPFEGGSLDNKGTGLKSPLCTETRLPTLHS